MRDFILADNQELTRLGLRTLLSEFQGSTVTVVEDKAALVDQLRRDSNVVVIIDYTLFDFTDEDNLLIVSERFHDALWLLISDELSHSSILKFIYSSKRFSIVFKDTPIHILREAIRVTLSGSRYICQHVTEALISDIEEEDKGEPSTLTATELAVLKSIAQGHTTKEIAAERCSSVHTINTHRKNIFRKLGVNTAHEAVKYAFRAGLVSPSEFYI